MLFITTANKPDRIPPALRDRLEIVELPGYTEADKESSRHASQPTNGFRDRLVRDSESTGNRRVVQAKLVKVKGFGSDPLVNWGLLNHQNRHLEGHFGEGANSFRARPPLFPPTC